MLKSVVPHRPLSLHAGISAVREFRSRNYPSVNVRQLGNMINTMPFHTAQRVLEVTSLDNLDGFDGFERTAALLKGNVDPIKTALLLRMLDIRNPSTTKKIFSVVEEDLWTVSARKYASDFDNYNRNSILHEVGTMLAIIRGHSEQHMDSIDAEINKLAPSIEELHSGINMLSADLKHVYRLLKALEIYYKDCNQILQNIANACDSLEQYFHDPDHGAVRQEDFDMISGVDTSRLWNYLIKKQIITQYGIIQPKFISLPASLGMKPNNNFKAYENQIYSILLKANTYKITIAWFLQRIREIKQSMEKIVTSVTHLRQHLPFPIDEIENSIKTLKEILKRYYDFTIEEFLFSGKSIDGGDHFPEGIKIAADIFVGRENPNKTILDIDRRQRARLAFPGGEYFIPEYKAFLEEILDRNLDPKTRSIIYSINESIMRPDIRTHKINQIN